MKNLVAFILVILLIEGCSYYDIVKIDKSEFLREPKEKISKVGLESGDFVQFNEDGGRYYNLNNCIAGMTREKGFTIVPMGKINNVESNWGSIAIGEGLSADTTYISQVLLTNGNSITFRELFGGGKYYKENKSIIAGVDTSFRHYQIGMDKISFLDIYKLNYTKSLLSDIGLAGVVAVVIYFISKAHFSSSGGNGWNFDL